MAALSWLVPLATVYPPTALTIQSELHTTFMNVNASIMNSTLPFELAVARTANSLAFVNQDIVPGSATRPISFHRVLYTYVNISYNPYYPADLEVDPKVH
jgi:hypothetical protein